MVPISKEKIVRLFDRFREKKILVLGDVMLDRYLWGVVRRISPEAPVPVVEIEREFARLGGAANVGNNIKSLGGVPYLVGVIGEDRSGEEILSILSENKLPVEGIVRDPERPTTVKTRVIAHGQHVVRTDRESRKPITGQVLEHLKQTLLKLIPRVDAIIIEDYNKGLIVEELILFAIQTAKQFQKPVMVDPKFDNFFTYRDVAVFKPNRKEAEEALGMRLNTRQQIEKAGHLLFEKLNPDCLMITLGEEGMAVFEASDRVSYVPTRARKVRDVSGAGDTVISTLTMALVSGASFPEAASLANRAAGLVCEEVGIVPIDRERLLETYLVRGPEHG
ncbi:MAG: D-glycero-beta-D-manno-heptose-7-phosphate kinase [Calditrichaeota bacterium]|nr:D-glycero-beta-D-manno-heptose-7-phosphate kinase [Calditrichota bacterium]